MIVRLTRAASDDLESIGDHIAVAHPGHAIAFVATLRSKCLDLCVFPLRVPLLPGYERQGVRHRVHGNYLIFYRVSATSVVVLHILHGARDYAALL